MKNTPEVMIYKKMKLAGYYSSFFTQKFASKIAQIIQYPFNQHFIH